ncbi:MAG TPA: AraC family transcriptional regulator [Burkholderiaceae bacterium]|nr:AraC family transcriptional regulator [Burkholderiaceae bacterium]
MPTADLAARRAPLPRNMLDCMRSSGVDPDAIAHQVGLDPQQLDSGLTLAEADRFLTAAWTALDDPAFGLRAGCTLRPERFGVVGIAAMSSPTLRVAFERKARYNRLIWGDVYEVEVRGTQGIVRVAMTTPPRPYSQAKIDLELASLVTFSRVFTGVSVMPLRVTLRQRAPSYRDRYAAVFGCPVAFDQTDDSVVFRTQDLALPLISANADIAGVLIEAAEARLEQTGDGEGDALRWRVTQALRRLLRGDDPTLAAVALQLHMSERTLQRRLAEQKLSFTDLLDNVRRESALEYLKARRVSVDEVAFLLGFATPSSFFRAFKRWTGTTPQGWRHTQAARA